MVTALCWKILLLSLPKFLCSQSRWWCSKHTKLHWRYLHNLRNIVRPVGAAAHRGAPHKTKERSSTASVKGSWVLSYSLQWHVWIFSLFVSWDSWTIGKPQFDFRKGKRISSSPKQVTSYSAQWTAYSLDNRGNISVFMSSCAGKGTRDDLSFRPSPTKRNQ